jgi:cysteinyl-tRNA synthetase
MEMDVIKQLLLLLEIDIASWKQSCYDAMNDDFNSNSNSTVIWSCTLYKPNKWWKRNLTAADLETFSVAMNAFVFDVLGLEGEKQQTALMTN